LLLRRKSSGIRHHAAELAIGDAQRSEHFTSLSCLSSGLRFCWSQKGGQEESGIVLFSLLYRREVLSLPEDLLIEIKTKQRCLGMVRALPAVPCATITGAT
jgi:hypothetical protein